MSQHRRARMSALVCLLLAGLLAACGPSASDDGARRATSGTVRSEVTCDLYMTGDGPRFETMHELAWVSSIIAVGTVTQESEPFLTDWYGQRTNARDYEIAVETLVRGAAADTATLTVRRHGVPVDGCEQHTGDPVYTPGERVLLFLWESGMPSADAPPLEPVMQADGVWRIATDGRVRIPGTYLRTSDRSLANVLLALATTLRGQPPLGVMAIGTAVALDVAPLRLDSSDGVPNVPPLELGPGCSGAFAHPQPSFVSATNLAWYSSMIIVGRVQERGQAYVLGDAAAPIIATDYAVTASERIRGVDTQGGSIMVRQLGGTVGDCTQTYEGDPALVIGQMVLLFLAPDERGPAGSAQVYPLGQQQGVWPIAAGDLASNDLLPGTAGTPRPLEEVIEDIVIGLHGVPPRGPLPLDQLVSERDAPLLYHYQQWSGLSDAQQQAARDAAEADPRVMALLGERGYRVTQAALWGPSAGPQPAAIIAFAFGPPATVEGEWFVRSYPPDACALDALPAPDIVSYRAIYSGVTEIHVLIRLNDDLFPVGVEVMEPFGKGGETLLGERDFTSAATDIVTCGW